MKKQDCPKALRRLLDLFHELVPKYDIVRVFEDFLTLVIGQYNIPEEYGNHRFYVIDDEHAALISRYKPAELEVFSNMVFEFLRTMASELTGTPYEQLSNCPRANTRACLFHVYGGDPSPHKWVDVLGEFYMELVSSYKASRLGQFFTPKEICVLMAMLNDAGQGENRTKADGSKVGPNNRLNVNEPACGSGGMIMPFHASAPGHYNFVLQDVDNICCKMAVINCLLHGVPCQIICQDALNPEDFRRGWYLNERLFFTTAVTKLQWTPHVRDITVEQSHIHQFWEERYQEIQAGTFPYIFPNVA